MRVRIETERLILRNLEPDDSMEMFAWCGDPAVNEFMCYPLYQSHEAVRSYVESLNPDDKDNYDLGFVLKETGELIGLHREYSLNYKKTDGSREYEASIYRKDYVFSHEYDVKSLTKENVDERSL